MDAVHTQNKNALPWQALKEYYNVCICSLTNPLTIALMDRYEELAQEVETSVGLYPLNPFPQTNWTAINDYPVIAIEGFEVIRSELYRIIKLKSSSKSR